MKLIETSMFRTDEVLNPIGFRISTDAHLMCDKDSHILWEFVTKRK